MTNKQRLVLSRASSVFHSTGRLVMSVLVVVAVLLFGAGPVMAGPTPDSTLKVCPSGCPYSEIAPALAVAKSGDTIKLAAGTYAGGVTIAASVNLVGAGSASTIIRGGGPVLTIGTFGASGGPTVSIQGVTITGGVTRSSPQSASFTGEEGVLALGGGVEIPPNADFTGGATVTISNSAITGNRVAPTHALPLGPPCPDGPCPFASAAGGGIDTWGKLTLANTTVTGNLVGSASGLSTVASDAEGGAIKNWLNDLTISNTTISGNRASATAPNGRFADAGGVFVQGGGLTMSNSLVMNNTATLNASLPKGVDMLAIAGGIHIGGGASAAIRTTTISDNSASMTNTSGDAIAFSGGVHTDVSFELSDDVIANNRVTSAALPGSSGNAFGDSGAGEMSGKISNTRFTGNSVTVRSAAADAIASAGAAIFAGSMTNSVVSGNQVHGSSPHGSVFVAGGGLQAGDAGITLRSTTVSGNVGDARGLTGSAQGGGIFDVAVPDGPPGGPLVLTNSTVTRNVLTGGAAVTLQGGGVFARNPVTLTHSVIAGNTPDQCDGCR
jgi:hypothetical protein